MSLSGYICRYQLGKYASARMIKFDSLCEKWEKNNCTKLFFICPREELNIHICDQFSYEFSKINPDANVDIVVHSQGKNVSLVKIICDVIYKHKGRKRIYIPIRAFDCSTILTFVGDELYMCKNTHIGGMHEMMQCDNERYSTTVIERVSSSIKLENTLKVFLWNETAKLFNATFGKFYDSIIDLKYPDSPGCKIKEYLTSEAYSHEYVFSMDECKNIGLKMTGECPSEMIDIIGELITLDMQ